MPEPTAADGPSTEQRLARVVVNVSGVARLEPSLARAVRRLSRLGGSPDDVPDGVTLTRHEDAVDVAVEISVTGPGTALDTAAAVREAVLAELSGASLRGGAVSVRVLSVEPDPAGTDSALTASDGAHDGQREREQRSEPISPSGGEDPSRPSDPAGDLPDR